jgi:hypothetical protein
MGDLTEEQKQWLLMLKEFGAAFGIDTDELAARQQLDDTQSPGVPGVTVKAPQPGSGGEAGDDSWVAFSPSLTLKVNGKTKADGAFNKRTTVRLKAGEQGVLQMNLKISGMADNITFNKHFSHELTMSWDVSADSTGKVHIAPPQTELNAPTGDMDTFYRLDSINPDKNDDGIAFVQISPVVVGGSDGGGVSAVIDATRTAAPPKIQHTIRVDIAVDIPKVAVKEPDTLAQFEYKVGPFAVGSSDKLMAGGVSKQVYDILYTSIPPSAKESLLQGNLPGAPGQGKKIELHGFTSNTDSAEHNLDLSRKRAEFVLAAFKALGLDAKLFAGAYAHGEWEVSGHGMAPTDDKKKERESDDWRKVVVKMMHGRK